MQESGLFRGRKRGEANHFLSVIEQVLQKVQRCNMASVTEVAIIPPSQSPLVETQLLLCSVSKKSSLCFCLSLLHLIRKLEKGGFQSVLEQIITCLLYLWIPQTLLFPINQSFLLCGPSSPTHATKGTHYFMGK